MTGVNNVTPAIVNPSVTTAVPQKDNLGQEFSTILDSLNIGTQTQKPTTDDGTATSALKETLTDLFNGDIDAVNKDLASLSDEDKAVVMSLLQALADIADAEATGKTAEGSSQALINSLFGKITETDSSSSSSADKAIEALKQALSKAQDGTETTDISAILAQLVPMLLALSSATTNNSAASSSNAVTGTTAIEGSVSVQSGSATKTIKLDSYADALQDILDELNGKTADTTKKTTVDTTVIKSGTTTTTVTTTTTTTTAPDATAGNAAAAAIAGSAAPTTDTTAAPATGTTVVSSSVTVTTTDGIAQAPSVSQSTSTSDTADKVASAESLRAAAQISSAGAETAESAPKTTGVFTNLVLTAQKPSASDKLMSEGSISKTSILSQRVVQKSSELEDLKFDISNTAGVTAQNVQQAPSIELPQAISDIPVDKQIMDNITTQLSTLETGKSSEMTMTLNPDNLGQISVKLQNELGKITVTIAAQSDITQKLLQDKLPSLISSLNTINPDVKDVRIIEPNQSTSFASLNLTNSDAGQSSSYSNSNSQPRSYSTGSVQSTSEVLSDTSTAEFKGGNKLWQTA